MLKIKKGNTQYIENRTTICWFWQFWSILFRVPAILNQIKNSSATTCVFLFSAFTQRKVPGGPHRTWFPTKPGLAACPMNLMNSSILKPEERSNFWMLIHNCLVVSTNPIWKICSSKWINSPRFGVKNATYLKPPPSSMRFQPWSLHLHQPLMACGHSQRQTEEKLGLRRF